MCLGKLSEGGVVVIKVMVKLTVLSANLRELSDSIVAN